MAQRKKVQPAPKEDLGHGVRRWRCMVEGCALYGVWQRQEPHEPYYPSSHRLSHYGRFHAPAAEGEYRRILADQREKRLAHYRLTGEVLPPEF